MLLIGVKNFFFVKNVKITVPWTYINGEENMASFFEKELEKTNQKEFRFEKK